MVDKQNLLSDELMDQLGRYPEKVARVFHGRGRFFPGLEDVNVEWYPPVLFVQCYESELGEKSRLALLNVFEQIEMIDAVILQTRPWPDFSNEILFTRRELSQTLPLEFTTQLDTDLKCRVSLGANRNTGVFPDMSSGWEWVRQHSKEKRVLNLFSYTSVFSLFALKGGAKKVVNIDMCGSATKTAQVNHEINGLLDEKVSIWKKNILKSNSQIAKQSKFDIVILDPPPFHKGSFKGWSDYQKLLRRCVNYLREGGIILAALNDQQVSFFEFAEGIRKTIEVDSITRLALGVEIRELEPEKGLKLALIKF